MPRLFLATALLLVGCGSDGGEEQWGQGLNWTITSKTKGSQTCLDVSAAKVEWLFRHEDGRSFPFAWDCVALEPSSVSLPSGRYLDISAKLKRGDGVVLATCSPGHDNPLSPHANRIDQCIFEVP